MPKYGLDERVAYLEGCLGRWQRLMGDGLSLVEHFVLAAALHHHLRHNEPLGLYRLAKLTGLHHTTVKRAGCRLQRIGVARVEERPGGPGVGRARVLISLHPDFVAYFTLSPTIDREIDFLHAFARQLTPGHSAQHDLATLVVNLAERRRSA